MSVSHALAFGILIRALFQLVKSEYTIYGRTMLPLMNLARASMPVFVQRIVASLWSGAPSSIPCQCSSWMSHSNSMCSHVWSSAPHGQSMGSRMLCIRQNTHVPFALVSVKCAERMRSCQRGWYGVGEVPCEGIGEVSDR